MLTYVFEKNDVPLYEQVYQRIKGDIISGSLKPGEKLPSKRTFAHNRKRLIDRRRPKYKHPMTGCSTLDTFTSIFKLA